MLKLFLLLYWEFAKTGLFAIGGGYAALPFLLDLQQKYDWYTLEELSDMIAVSNITPGPVGINMATYTGYTTAGIWGALSATTAIVSIPFVLCVILSKLFNKYQNCSAVSQIFAGLRPASCALLASVAVKLLYNTLTGKEFTFAPIDFVDLKALLLFVIILIPFWFLKKNPLLSIVIGALGGIIIKFW